MIKFKHKKHIDHKESGKIVIYYNLTDIFLGTALMILVVFFIHNYLSHTLSKSDNKNYEYLDQTFEGKEDMMAVPIEP